MVKRARELQLHIRVTPKERELIYDRMKRIGTRNMGAYLRKMAIDGYVIQLDTSDVRELVRVLRITSNSLNQLARRANETGNVYRDDIEDLRKSYNNLWGVAEEIMVRLASI